METLRHLPVRPRGPGPGRVLLVGPDAGSGRETVDALRAAGVQAEVEIVRDDDEALARSRESGSPRALVVDLDHLGAQGPAVVGALRTRRSTSSAPAIAVASRGRIRELVDSIEAGASIGLMKPLDASRVASALRAIGLGHLIGPGGIGPRWDGLLARRR